MAHHREVVEAVHRDNERLAHENAILKAALAILIRADNSPSTHPVVSAQHACPRSTLPGAGRSSMAGPTTFAAAGRDNRWIALAAPGGRLRRLAAGQPVDSAMDSAWQAAFGYDTGKHDRRRSVIRRACMKDP